MKRETISQGVGNVSARFVQEAAVYTPEKKRYGRFGGVFVKNTAAAVIVLCVLVCGAIVLFPSRDGAVAVHAYGTDKEITAAGAVMDTGTISDTGEMRGKPLMFYLTGEDISSVRFSCRNQMLYFTDWTEERDGYGNARNFTVAYGSDESEYYYLTVDWVPNATIRELTDNADSSIASLPDELREDIIVMEITFEDGKTVTKAITVSLQDDGTFFASFDDYEIKDSDAFVNRPDSEAEEGNTEQENALDGQGDGTVTFHGTIMENMIDTAAAVILIKPMGDEIPYDAVFFELQDEDAEWVLRVGAAVTIVCKEDFTEPAPHFGTLISITGAEEGETDSSLTADQIEAAKQAALAYYEGTVFSVNSIEYLAGELPYGDREGSCNFTVNVSKNGVVQEPDRTISLQPVRDGWEVVNEGY